MKTKRPKTVTFRVRLELPWGATPEQAEDFVRLALEWYRNQIADGRKNSPIYNAPIARLDMSQVIVERCGKNPRVPMPGGYGKRS